MISPVLLAAVAAGVAYAADDCTVTGTKTIDSAADATGLAGCSTFSGHLAIATGIEGQFSLPGVKTIQGNLVARSVPKMTRFTAPNLEIISGNFDFDGVETLDTLSLPKLVEVGSIRWRSMPALSNVELTSGLNKAPSIDIQNTGLSKLDTIFPPLMDTIFIANNFLLQTLDIKLGNISDALSLSSNGDRLEVTFPNLTWAKNLTIRNVQKVSLPKLQEIRGDIGFYENIFTSLAAPELTKVDSSFAIVSNNKLTNTSFPKLESVGGGFQIANNTELDSVSGFPSLKSVGGAFDANGAFDKVEIPSLEVVRGAFNLQSSEDITQICDDLAEKRKAVSGFIRGKFVCAGSLSNPAGEGTNPGVSSATNSPDDSAASSASVSMSALALAGVVAGLMSFF